MVELLQHASIWNDLDSSPGTDLDTEALINLVDSYREDYTFMNLLRMHL